MRQVCDDFTQFGSAYCDSYLRNFLRSSPSVVYDLYLDARKSGNVDEVVTAIGPVVRGVYQQAGLDLRSTIAQGLQVERREKGGIASFSVKEDSVQGDTAYVRYEIHYGNGAVEQDREAANYRRITAVV